MTIYEYVQGELEGYGLRQLEQLGFENTYAIGVPEDWLRSTAWRPSAT